MLLYVLLSDTSMLMYHFPIICVVACVMQPVSTVCHPYMSYTYVTTSSATTIDLMVASSPAYVMSCETVATWHI